MADEADNLVIRHLRELRTHLDERFEALGKDVDARLDVVDVRLIKLEGGQADLKGLAYKALTELVDLNRRLDVEGDRLRDRLTAIEKRLTDLEGRRGS